MVCICQQFAGSIEDGMCLLHDVSCQQEHASVITFTVGNKI